MAQAAYKAVVSISGTPVQGSRMATKWLGAGSGFAVYAINTVAHRVLDPTKPVVVRDNTGVLDPTDAGDAYTVDYLFGRIVFGLGVKRGGSVTVDAHYIPTTSVIGANTFSIDMGGDVLDDTSFDKTNTNGGQRTRAYGLHDVSVTLERFYDLKKTFNTAKLDRGRVLIDIAPGGGSHHVRGWFVLESDNLSGDVGALENESLTFQLDGDDKTSFAWKSE